MGIGRLLLKGKTGVEHVVIPIEHCFSGILQELEETGFYSIQHVEADKYIALVAQSVGVELLHDIAVHHAFVGDAQFCKIAAVVAVDVAQFIPEGDEFGFQLRALFYGKVLEELADGFFLFLVEEVVIVHNVLQFLQVAEEFVGIYKVFVYVIEIADEQFSPEVEVIQSFFAAGLFAEHLIQFAYQADRVTGLQWRELPEQFADADVGRRPQRAVRFSCQIFVEEQTGTFVGENDGGAREVVSYFGVKVAGDQLEECFHDLVDN